MTNGEGWGGVRLRVAACPAAFARPPAADEVYAWVVDLARPPVEPAELFARLTAEERARAVRYKIAKAREQFVIYADQTGQVDQGFTWLHEENVDELTFVLIANSGFCYTWGPDTDYYHDAPWDCLVRDWAVR